MPTIFKPSKDTLSGLYVQSPDGKQQFPLKHTEVQAKIAGNISRVELTQTFENSFTEPLEAVYVFPLPSGATVINLIKRSLLAWQVPQCILGKVRLTLRIQS